MPINRVELDTVARTIYGEARGESFEGQVAVAWVIKNRSIKRRRTLMEICLAPFQFSCWNSSDPNKAIIERVNFDDLKFTRAYGIACLVNTGNLPDPTENSDHYHTIARPKGARQWPPSWASSLNKIKEIGNHVFYRS